MTDPTPTPDSSPKKPRFSRRFIRSALIASLALNLLIIGGAAGARWAHHHWNLGEHGRGLMGYAWSIKGERGDEIRQMIRAGRTTLKPLRKSVREKRKVQRALLQGEAFDRAAIRAAMSDTADARRKLKDTRANIFLDALEKMSPEDRAGFHKWRNRHHRRWRRRHRDE